ncbi:MAG: ArsR/SmtB family transcription factor [Candidatus Hodarchaeota archaeon]
MPENRQNKDIVSKINDIERNYFSNPQVQNILKTLKDETRQLLFILLMINEKLTLKQLSDLLNKGKTTVHHHIKRLEERRIVMWEEKEADKKTLKTRYYSLNYDLLNSIFGV